MPKMRVIVGRQLMTREDRARHDAYRAELRAQQAAAERARRKADKRAARKARRARGDDRLAA